MASAGSSAIAELSEAAKELSLETKRLQSNLQKLHKFQSSLLVISREWIRLMGQEVDTINVPKLQEERALTWPNYTGSVVMELHIVTLIVIVKSLLY